MHFNLTAGFRKRDGVRDQIVDSLVHPKRVSSVDGALPLSSSWICFYLLATGFASLHQAQHELALGERLVSTRVRHS